MAVVFTQTANPAGVASASGVSTYAGVDIGTAGGDRTLWIAATSGTTTSAAQPTALTVNFGAGPISATKATTGPTLGNMSAEVFYIPAPTATSTSTTATVSVTWSAAVLATNNQIAVYKATGASSTPQAAGGNTSTDMDASTPLTSGSQSVNPGGLFFDTAAGSADTSTHSVAGSTAVINADAGTFHFVTATRTTTAAAAATIQSTVNGSDGAMAWVIAAPGGPQSKIVGSATGTSTGAAVGTFFTSGTASSVGTSTAIAEGIRDHHIQLSWVELEGVQGEASGASPGSSTGTSTVAAVGAATKTAVAASTGLATTAATGASSATAAGSSTGTSTVLATGAAQARGQGSVAGLSTVLGTGAASTTASGASTGLSTVSGVSSATAASAGASTGLSTVTGISAAQARGAGSSAGTSTVSATGTGTTTGQAQSTGTSTVAAVSAATAASAGTVTGLSTVLGTGAASTTAAGASTGLATVSAVSSATKTAVGAVAGTSTVSGSGSGGATAIGSSTGTGTVLGVGAASTTAAGAVTGLSTVSAVSSATKTAVFNAAGTTTADAAGSFTSGGVSSGDAKSTGRSFNTVLLVHADGTDGSTTFTDSSPLGRTITAQGAAQVDTGFSKFGGAAALFSGADADYLAVAGGDSLILNNDFTISFWVYPTALTFEPICSDATHVTSPRFKIVAISGTTQWNPGGGTNINGAELALNTWTHLEVGRSGTTTKFFINGVSQGTPATGELPIFVPVDFRIGTAGNSGWTLNGSIDELRVLNGLCAHTSDFTPPVAAYTVDPSFVGASTATAAMASAGTGTVSGISSATKTSVGAVSGLSTVSATGAVSTTGVGNVAGLSTANATGAETAADVGLSTGTSTVLGVGAASTTAVGSSAGTSTVQAAGTGTFVAQGSSTGTSTVLGTGASSAATVGNSTGSSTADATSAASKTAVFNSDGLAASNVIIVDFSAVPPVPAVGPPYGAGPSRKRFRELLRELEEEAREAEAKARQVKGKARKKLRQVAEAAHAVAEAQRLAESTEVQSQIVTLSNIIEGAIAAKTTTEIIQESNVAIAAAKEIMDELDDLEAIALLVA